MNYSSKFNNLLKNISTNVQQKVQKKTKKEEQKQETLFDLGQANLKKDELKSDDLYGGMISLSKSSSDSNGPTVKTTKFQSLLNKVNNNVVKKNDTAITKMTTSSTADATKEIAKDVKINNNTTTSSSAKLKSLLNSVSVKASSAMSSTPILTQSTEVEKAPKAEKSVEEMQTENLAKTINSVEKYVARIDLSSIDYINPQTDIGAGYYDFTDYNTEYDEQNRVTKLTPKYNTGVTVNIAYDASNNVTVNCDNGRTFTLNSEGKITSFTQKDYSPYTYEYDNDGKLIKTVSHQYVDVNYTDYTYDEHGNMVDNGIGGKYINTYDTQGNLMSVTLGNNKIEYDANGNIIKEITYNNTITYEYDENNNFVKATDIKGNEYDKHGNVIKYTSVDKGTTYTRESKTAENGQKIISNKWTNDEGITIEFITDANGFDMSQTVKLTDGTTIETTFDSKSQDWANYGTNKLSCLSDKRFGMFGRSGVSVLSQTVKNSDGTIAYTLDAPTGLNSLGMLFLDINNVNLKNLSFNNGEKVLVNEDMSLNVTKTDGAIDIYDYNTKTRNFELRETIPAPTVEPTVEPTIEPTVEPLPDLPYDLNKDGVVDYKDVKIAAKDNYEIVDFEKIVNEAINTTLLTPNIDMKYYLDFNETVYSLPTWSGSIPLNIQTTKHYDAAVKRIEKAIVDGIYKNKENSFDFNKDGKLNIDDVKILIKAFNATASGDLSNMRNMPGIDFNGDGEISFYEQLSLYAPWELVDDFMYEALMSSLLEDKENLPNVISELKAFKETLIQSKENYAINIVEYYIDDLENYSKNPDAWEKRKKEIMQLSDYEDYYTW